MCASMSGLLKVFQMLDQKAVLVELLPRAAPGGFIAASAGYVRLKKHS